MAPAFPLEIFYDGSCRVCSSEIEHYRQRNPQQRLRFIDIRAAGFQPSDYGKSQAEFMARLHVRDQQGQFFSGVDAFLLIWQAYPSGSPYRWLGAVIGLPGINLLARGGYRVFARYRHLLPKKSVTCDDDSCNLNPPH
ncbi:MAG TPA: DUF393 domain-containing protein [Malonomonas sp.]